MKFTKMHGCGNDYIYVNCFKERIDNPEVLSRALSDRHFGIGSDGMILICPSDNADFRMQMYNSDGTEGKMCGNGVRCIAKYVYDYGLTDKSTISLETKGGIKYLDMHISDGKVASATVDMGTPILASELIPVAFPKHQVINEPLNIGGTEYKITCVSMGNPHVVVFVSDLSSLDLEHTGPLFEHHPMFPEGVNTEFVELIDDNTIRMRVWERGSGETLACGTGACASVMACILNGKTGHQVTVHLLGGDLEIRHDESSNHVFMRGPATTVFDGEIDIEQCLKKG